MNKSRWILSALVFLGAVAGGAAAFAAEAGAPVPWQMNFRDPATPVMEDIVWFHNLILWIEAAIVLLVLGLMVWIILKFNAKSNPTPSTRTHHTMLEVAWTVVPVLILLVIAVPSMKLLFFMDKAKDPEMTLKIVGHQWYWSYEYPDHGDFTFDSNMIPDDELKPGQPRLLAVDNHVVLPADTEIRLLMTSEDVIHDWGMPNFGIKMDTVPGRINESWMMVPSERIGTYYGQCSELCGVNHAFMPIAVDIVSKEEFQRWVEEARARFARTDGARPVELVRAGAASR